MLEFVLFDLRPRQSFADFLRARGICAIELEGDETFGIEIPEHIDDVLLARVETYCDEMIALSQELFESNNAMDDQHVAGVVLNLASGETVCARVQPGLLARIMENITPQEFGDLVDTIVDAVEDPHAGPLCRRRPD